MVHRLNTGKEIQKVKKWLKFLNYKLIQIIIVGWSLSNISNDDIVDEKKKLRLRNNQLRNVQDCNNDFN